MVAYPELEVAFAKILRLTRLVFLVFVVLWRSDPSTCSTQTVSINSTLIREQFALPGQQVTFTCVATNTTLLEWYSNEYIGPNGDLLPISSFGQARNRTRGSTVATRVGVNVVNGITTITSQLHITTSDVYPTSSVICGIDGVGPRQRINFATTITALQEVSVTSSLIREQFAFPGQRVIFTCVARNTTLLEWYSDEYIGPNGDLLPISRFGEARNRTRGSTVATRVRVDIVNGITTVTSELYITASDMYPTSSVTCSINNIGPHQRVSFTTTSTISSPVLLTSDSGLSKENIATDGEMVTFTCVIEGGLFLTWSSDEYIQLNGLQLAFSHPVGVPMASPRVPGSSAMLTSVTLHDNGHYMMESRLQIQASLSKPIATITCRNNSHGFINRTSFQVVAAPPKTTTEQQQDLTTVHLEVAITISSFVSALIVILAVVALVAVVTVVAVATFLRSRRKSSATPGDKNSPNDDKNLPNKDDDNSPNKDDKDSLNKDKDDRNSSNNDLDENLPNNTRAMKPMKMLALTTITF